MAQTTTPRCLGQHQCYTIWAMTQKAIFSFFFLYTNTLNIFAKLQGVKMQHRASPMRINFFMLLMTGFVSTNFYAQLTLYFLANGQ